MINDEVQNDLRDERSEKYTANNEDIEPMPNKSSQEINGDNSYGELFLQNDDSCTSTSTSSSHNLVIDQSVDVVNNTNCDSDEVIKKSKQDVFNPLKRKYKTHDNNTSDHKQRCLMQLSPQNNIKSFSKNFFDSNRSDNSLNSKAVSSAEGSKKHLNYATENEKDGKGIDHFQEYAKYLRLKPALKYKCFKCYNTFETLIELRSHQKVCLFKENHRHSSHDSDKVQDLYPREFLIENSSIMVSNEQIQVNLEKQYYDTKTTAKAKKKVFLCAACGTYYENWNLFLHMREVHKRHICLYCVGMFPSAERLTLHLEMKHDLEQNHFETHEKLLRASRDTCYIMCCICEHIFTEHEDFQDHVCSELTLPCTLCGQKEKHSTICKSLHLERSLKENLKKKSKLYKRKILNVNRPEITNSTQLTDNIRPLTSNFCDKKKQKMINQDNWNVKLNGFSDSSSIQFNDQESATIENLSTDNNNSFESVIQVQSQNCSNISNLEKEIYDNPTSEIRNENSENRNDRILFKINHNLKDNTESNGMNKTNFLEKDNNDTSATPNKNDYQGSHLYSQGTLKSLVSRNVLNSVEFSNCNGESSSHNFFTAETNNTVEAEKGDSDNIVENEEEEKPLLVPKFKIKIPKEYQNTIEPENSSSESGEDQEVSSNYESLLIKNEKGDERDENIDEVTCIGRNNETHCEIRLEKECDDKKDFTEISQCVNECDRAANADVKDTKTCEKDHEAVFLADGLEIASEDVLIVELLLDQPIDKISIVEFLRICIKSTYPICLYCNHARRIAVNGYSLALHMIAQHRFSATVDSITAEELRPSTIVTKFKSSLPDLTDIFFNMETFCNTDKETFNCYEKIFECFLCRFETRIHKELYLHNRKMHLKTAILCFMCRANFFSYSEILCHMCPGMPNKCVIFDIKFRCCLCNIDQIPSAFRLMVHLRKKHFACDVCLEDCLDQSRLSSHVWKHKLHHLCYRCGIAYRNKPDITKHLFWKHGTESVLCKRCLQKRWPHVYHFCIPPLYFACEICNITFSKAMFLKVHKRLHTGDAPYPCTEDNCHKKFISKKLLLKHLNSHINDDVIKPTEELKIEIEMKNEADNNEVQNEENTEEVVKKSVDPSRKKKKKIKKSCENKIDDLVNLPAPNLSESDSSDESEKDKTKTEIYSSRTLSPMFDIGEDEKEVNTSAIMDIWENFKSFQASQKKKNDDNLESDIPIVQPILHVTQSDHDYCLMYKVFVGKTTNDTLIEKQLDEKNLLKESTKESCNELAKEYTKQPYKELIKEYTKEPCKERVKESTEEPCEERVKESNKESSKELVKESTKNSCKELTKTSTKDTAKNNALSKKKQKSPRKLKKSCSDSTSSDSTSSSDSSCSCGTNCSCSSSSDSSSDSSSSSDDSDSSTSEGRRKKSVKRAAKANKLSRLKNENSLKDNTSNVVDVVKIDPELHDGLHIDTAILESDLETDESDTDEEFYDEHPQKLATQLLAEKRKQLMIQTCLSPSHNFDIVENSRPSTPSLPEETMREKKVKIKKKKRDKKISKGVSIPTFKLNIPSMLNKTTTSDIFEIEEIRETTRSKLDIPLEIPNDKLDQNLQLGYQSQPLNPPNSILPLIPAPVAAKSRLSTGSSSDADAPLKRSKRARRPNRFYGYSSDDDSFIPQVGSAFKPTPPPNLTWRKEDLPTPSKYLTTRTIKSPANVPKKSTPSTPSTPPLLPPIPPIIIRPSGISYPKSSAMDYPERSPPVVEPMRVPPLPVHHVQSTPCYRPSRESIDSESSDEGRLHIPVPNHSKSQKQINLYNASRKTIAETVQSIPTPRIPLALLPNPDLSRLQYFKRNNIRWPVRPPAGARPPRDGESVYCYCRCPYDEVSEMIACDGDDCMIEWFHFECVGIMVPPKGKWFCPECRSRYPQDITERCEEI